MAARHAYVAANRSNRLASAPNRPPARSATNSAKQRAASNLGCGFGAVCTTTLRPGRAATHRGEAGGGVDLGGGLRRRAPPPAAPGNRPPSAPPPPQQLAM